MFGPVMTSNRWRGIEIQVIGNKRRVDHLFDHEVAATLNFDAGRVGDISGLLRLECFGAFGETGKYVQLGDGEMRCNCSFGEHPH